MTVQARTTNRGATRGFIVLGLMALLVACSAHDQAESQVSQVTAPVQQASSQDDLPTVVIRAKRDRDNIWRIAANTAKPAS